MLIMAACKCKTCQGKDREGVYVVQRCMGRGGFNSRLFGSSR